ncbi:MAG: ArnT family glycosyltransferase [Marinosulfonomonas sp.]
MAGFGTRLGPLLTVAMFLLLCVWYWPFVADDAFIVGRYALNAADGIGLVYNPGERVSALTSPLHALFETGLAFFTDDPVNAYRLLAPVLPIAGVFAAARIAGLRRGSAALFFVIALTSPFLAIWTVGGLETPMLFALIAVYVAMLARIGQRKSATGRDFVVLGLLAGLTFLTRYDSIFVVLPPMLALATVYWRRAELWIGAAVALIIAGSWLAFAYFYYGDVIPTSAHVKLGFYRNPEVYNFYTVINFVIVTGLVILVPLATIPKGEGQVGRALYAGVALSLVFFTLYALRASGQHMMFGYRMFVPYLPAVAMILAIFTQNRTGRSAAIAGLLNVFLAVGVGFVGMSLSPVSKLPGLEQAYQEMQRTTPKVYGKFIDILRQDAVDLKEHWASTGQTTTPRIFLYTGGTGYWMRNFNVSEVLLSYRHNCIEKDGAILSSVHYIQDFGDLPLNRTYMEFFSARADAVQDSSTLSESELVLGYPTYIRYAYAPDPGPFRLPDTVNGPCD